MVTLNIARRWIVPGCMLAIASLNASANCVPSVPNAPDLMMTVPFTMTVMNTKTNDVSFTSGLLGADGKTWYAEELNQQFSDREYRAPASSQEQTFSVLAEDKLGVQVVPTSTGANLTFTLDSWGYGTISISATCDKVSGVLYGSGSWSPNTNNVMIMIQFGAIAYSEFI